ncbi:MAG TPA: O-methyltransferase [Jatrophihabitans sp.]|nr:O-methyltransferase [Jatrophihabitans sp.]
MYDGEQAWSAVDDYFISQLVKEDAVAAAARASSRQTVMPLAEVAPNQAAFLAIIARIAGARRVLEFGTLAGYSTIWLARAAGDAGQVVTLELDEPTARIAQANFDRAGVADRIELLVGPALLSAQALLDRQEPPFDLVFIDADKPNNPAYLDAALALSRPGTVIIGDNVVRNGAVTDASSSDPRVQGTRAMIGAMGSNDGLLATALQTVGGKGWDGFAIAVVQ